MNNVSREKIRNLNRQNAINTFYGKSEVSKSDIMERTGLCAATVGTLIDDLLKEGLISEERFAASGGGRRPMLYTLNEGFYYVLVYQIDTEGVSVSLFDMFSKMVASKSLARTMQGPESVTKGIALVTENLKAGSSALFPHVRYIGVSMPGIMHYSTSVVTFSNPLKLQDFSLLDVFKELFPDRTIPVRVFKDTDAMIYGEYFENGGVSDSMAYILCKEGVGFSVITRGKLYWNDDCSMELGYTVIDYKTGKRAGQLLGIHHLVERYVDLLQVSHPEVLPNLSEIDFPYVCARYNEGDLDAWQAVSDQIEAIVCLAANVANLFNPKKIVIGGYFSLFLQGDALERKVKERVLSPFAKDLEVTCGRLETSLSLKGMSEAITKESFFKTIKL